MDRMKQGRCFVSSMPGIEALVDGQVRPYRADLVLRSQGGKLVGAIVVLHQHLSRRTLDALAEAWSECADVSEVVFYAIPDICEQLEQAIARVHSGVTLKLKTIPLSRSARMRLNAAKGRDLQAKHNLDAEREREEWRKEWTDADPPFEELTDGEWEVLDPILSPGRRKEIHWKGLRLRNDRQIINTLLLASYLGRPLSVMTVFMGYESGVTCRRRLEDWRDAGILGEAWQKLTDMSPHRDLPSSDSLIKRERQVDARGLFNYLDWQEILRADAIVWEGLERARTSGQVSPATQSPNDNISRGGALASRPACCPGRSRERRCSTVAETKVNNQAERKKKEFYEAQDRTLNALKILTLVVDERGNETTVEYLAKKYSVPGEVVSAGLAMAVSERLARVGTTPDGQETFTATDDGWKRLLLMWITRHGMATEQHLVDRFGISGQQSEKFMEWGVHKKLLLKGGILRAEPEIFKTTNKAKKMVGLAGLPTTAVAGRTEGHSRRWPHV